MERLGKARASRWKKSAIFPRFPAFVFQRPWLPMFAAPSRKPAVVAPIRCGALLGRKPRQSSPRNPTRNNDARRATITMQLRRREDLEVTFSSLQLSNNKNSIAPVAKDTLPWRVQAFAEADRPIIWHVHIDDGVTSEKSHKLYCAKPVEVDHLTMSLWI